MIFRRWRVSLPSRAEPEALAVPEILRLVPVQESLGREAFHDLLWVVYISVSSNPREDALRKSIHDFHRTSSNWLLTSGLIQLWDLDHFSLKLVNGTYSVTTYKITDDCGVKVCTEKTKKAHGILELFGVECLV